MKIHPSAVVDRLEKLPNIGKNIAADLRAIGVDTPAEFARHKPIDLYHRLGETMGERRDPCVLHTFLSVAHFQKSGEKIPWWKFTEEGRAILAKSR